MVSDDEQPAVFDAVESSLCADPEITFVVAFGSRVDGEPHSSSDLDVAVKFADDLSGHERFEKRCFLSGELQRAGAPSIDVVDIEALPVGVAHDAVHGERICGDEAAFRRFADEIAKRFDDERDDLHRRQRDVIDRIAEEGLRG